MSHPEFASRHFSFADERTLVAAVLRRDGAAWAELVRRYEPPVRLAIGRILVGHVDAAAARADVREVVADVYLGLVEGDLARLRAFDPARGLLGDFLAQWATRVTWAWVRTSTPLPCPVGDVPAPAPGRGARWLAFGL
jgi:hypothetical protein